MSPTQRTLKEIRKRGYKAGVVERWLRYAKRGDGDVEENEKIHPVFGKRQDLFGIIDVIAISKNETVGIQCCSSSFAGHFTKLTDEKKQESLDWIACPNRHLEIWSWRKVVKKRGSKMKVWRPRIHRITFEDLEI